MVRDQWHPHETEWMMAALTLEFAERQRAFRDISYMTSRPIEAVHDKASRMRCAMTSRRILVPERSCWRPARAIQMGAA